MPFPGGDHSSALTGVGMGPTKVPSRLTRDGSGDPEGFSGSGNVGHFYFGGSMVLVITGKFSRLGR